LSKTFNVFQITKEFFESLKVDVHAEPISTSTNDHAKSEAFSLSSPLKVYLADQQTAGRGRNGSTWSSPESGSALLITFSLSVEGPPQPITSPLCGLLLYEALTSTFPEIPLSIKAPNDIYLADKKVAGLLIEISQMGPSYRLIVGLGLNVFSLPKQEPNAAGLFQFTDLEKKKWCEFLDLFMTSLEELTQLCQSASLDANQRVLLKFALNKNPNLTEKLEQISPFGDLVFKSKTIAWRDL